MIPTDKEPLPTPDDFFDHKMNTGYEDFKPLATTKTDYVQKMEDGETGLCFEEGCDFHGAYTLDLDDKWPLFPNDME